MCKNTLVIAILVLVCATSVLALAHSAKTKPSDNCTFCGSWRPYRSKRITFAPDDVLVISRDSLAIPGCSPVKAHIVEQSFGKDVYDDPSKPLPIYVLYKLDEAPKCKRMMPKAHKGSFFEVCVHQPHFGVGSERMEASIVAASKQENGYRTYAMIEWYLIRNGYNPGDEGSGDGAWIAVCIEHRKVDEKLNEEWRRLLKVADGNKRTELKRRQRQWLKAIDKRCRVDRGAYPDWERAYYRSCLINGFEKRIGEFQDLRDCIMEKSASCPALATDDPSVNNMDVR
jgi:uncharacterized protein YecT (DUF1311 family)